MPDARTAKAIFLAVEQGLSHKADVRHFPLVDYDDEGDHWVVFRMAPPQVDRSRNEVIVTTGGGQLELQIAKCDGAISHAAFSK